MISLSHNFVFVHVPRTGGTAVEAALLPYAEPVLIGIEPFFCQPHLHKHATAAMIRNGLGDAAFRRAFKFAFVRNPWDWAVSNYLYNFGVHMPYAPQGMAERLAASLEMKKRPDFKDWLPFWTEKLKPSQHAMLCEDGRLLVDFVGRYERLSEDFAEACRRAGLPPLKLSWINASHKARLRVRYTPELDALVRRAFARDIELFGYDALAPV